MRRFLSKIFDEYLYKSVIYPEFNEPIYYSLKSFENRISRYFIDSLPFSLKKKYMKLIINERIVEIPFVFQNLKLPKGSKILDFGCGQSKLSLELASLGYRVTGVDLNDYDFTHPNFKFVKENFLKNGFSDEYFDAAIAVSSIEHVGLNAYGENFMDEEDGDYKTVLEIRRIFKTGGKFIMTIPFGKRGKSLTQRFYDKKALFNLLNGFKIEKVDCFIGLGRKRWTSANIDEAEKIDSVSTGFNQAVACVLCSKS